MKKCSWYEDDVVVYTTSGRFPVIPKYCKKTKLRCFRTKKLAEITLKIVCNFNKKEIETFTIYKCEYCQLYHIKKTSNYIKLRYL